jgi:hypothetical protein
VLEPLARVDYISPKMWVAGIKRFEKPFESFLSSFFNLVPILGKVNLPFFMEVKDFIHFQKIIAKTRAHQDLHIYHWNFCLMKK